MDLSRAFGVLLHPTSLPGPWGIGTLGKEARTFLDWLNDAGAGWWQVLPLGPTGYGDSPYQSFSAFSGNPYLIDIEELFSHGWLPEELPPDVPKDRVDFGFIYQWKWALLHRAYQGFLASTNKKVRQDFRRFQTEEADWLEDYALFMALKSRFGGRSWIEWPVAFRDRHEEALREASHDLADVIGFQRWTQWVFFTQWHALLEYAHAHGIQILGDMPIFVSMDSADVWANSRYFYLDEQARPTVVAGVPPDYFSETGQRWGNPLYRWDRLLTDGFSWWIRRIRANLKTADLVRIDHFRGFEGYWEIPASEPTAVRGQWVKAPGEALFEVIKLELGDVPIVAEDLGVITPEVEALRDHFGLPGMKVLQFAFSGENNPFLPHNYPENGLCIAYTGTHDNDTTLGWYKAAPKEEIDFMRTYLQRYGIRCGAPEEAAFALLQLGFKSPARIIMAPLQDLLGLDTDTRMNFPSKAEGNWVWRCDQSDFKPELAKKLRELAYANGRLH